MDRINAVAEEVARRMLGLGDHHRHSHLFNDLKELAVQALEKGRYLGHERPCPGAPTVPNQKAA